MLVTGTESGIVMLTRAVHPKKAAVGMLVVPSGMITAPLLSGAIKQSASHPATQQIARTVATNAR